jgi:hypothetical protein
MGAESSTLPVILTFGPRGWANMKPLRPQSPVLEAFGPGFCSSFRNRDGIILHLGRWSYIVATNLEPRLSWRYHSLATSQITQYVYGLGPKRLSGCLSGELQYSSRNQIYDIWESLQPNVANVSTQAAQDVQGLTHSFPVDCPDNSDPDPGTPYFAQCNGNNKRADIPVVARGASARLLAARGQCPCSMFDSKGQESGKHISYY